MKFIRVIKAEKIEDIEKPFSKYYQFPIVRNYIVKINKDFTNIDEELSKFKDIMSSTIFSFFEENEGNTEMDASYEIKVHFAKEKYKSSIDYNAGAIAIYAAYQKYGSEKEPKPSIEAYLERKKFMSVTTNNMEQMAKKVDYALDVIARNIKDKAEREQRYLNDEY